MENAPILRTNSNDRLRELQPIYPLTARITLTATQEYSFGQTFTLQAVPTLPQYLCIEYYGFDNTIFEETRDK